jgi:hypothetical protein
MTAKETIVRYSLGCPFTTQPEAPTPTLLDDERLTSVFGRKTEIREAWIAKTMADRNCERFEAVIEYDMNHASQTTNGRQLEEIGINIPSSDWINDSTDQEIHLVLWEIIYGLARLGIFLTGTDGHDDRDLLLHLCTKVLQDKVSDIPPTPDMIEFIDIMSIRVVTSRDHLLPTPDRSALFSEDPANN